MKKIKFLKKISCLMLVMLITLTGCNFSQSASKDRITTGVGYEDTVFNRELVEGKMAVYYLSSGLSISTWYNQTAGGDAMIIIMPDGTTAMLDCGHQGEGAHALNRLKQLGIEKLDYFIVSHPHTDHIGGFSVIARNVEIGHVYMPPIEVMDRADVVAKDFIDGLEEKNIPYTHLAAGDVVELSKDVTMKVYNPEPGFGSNTKINLNESSLLTKFIYKDSSYLMNGDIANNGTNEKFNFATEDYLVEKYGDELKADVSKIGHHGNADTLSSMEWRETVGAKIYATLTTFPRDYGEHMKNIQAGGISLNTALDGDFVIYTDGDGTYDVQVSKDRASMEYEVLDTKDGYMHVE
ncbi:MAG: MBL fold metallo-hydrolase [Tyzzerella sp.]|nr:MBL fold metallo-hydrolase [Tyzzerella sp.]